MTMSTFSPSTVLVSTNDSPFEQAHMAQRHSWPVTAGGRSRPTATTCVATSSGAQSVGLEVLEAQRPHIELWRAASEERGLAASTIDRRLSTICGFYRFAHIDGRIGGNPAQYVRRPKVYPSEGRGLDRGELGTFLFTAERYDHDHAALAALLGLNGLRVSEACATDVEDLGFGPWPPNPAHHRQGQQAGGDPARSPGCPDDRSGGRGAFRGADIAPTRRTAS